jgi:hypothetical protein
VPIFIDRGAPLVNIADSSRPIQDGVWPRRCAFASTAELAQSSALLGKEVGVSLQVERPTLISGHALADALPAFAMAL